MVRPSLAFNVVMLLCGAIPCHADPTFEEVRDWLLRERAAARGFPDLPLCEIVYTVEIRNRVTEEEVRALEEKVRREQQTSDAMMLQMLRSQLGKPNQVDRRRAWIENATNWRVNSDIDGDSIPFSDTTLRDRWACQSSIAELAIFDPRAGFPERRSVPRLGALISQPISDLLYGGASILPEGRPIPDGFSAEHNTFRVHYASNEPQWGGWSVEGAWYGDQQRGLIKRIVRHDDAPPSPAVVMSTCDEWIYDSEIRRWIATRVTKFRENGVLDRVVTFESSAAVSKQEFERVTSLPSPILGDAVRGPIAFAGINDYRPNPEQGTPRAPEEELPKVSGWNQTLASRGGWRVAGWTAFAVLGIVLVVLLVKRRVAV